MNAFNANNPAEFISLAKANYNASYITPALKPGLAKSRDFGFSQSY